MIARVHSMSATVLTPETYFQSTSPYAAFVSIALNKGNMTVMFKIVSKDKYFMINLKINPMNDSHPFR